MALIKQIKEGFKEKASIHKETECTYYIVQGIDKNKYLQLDTYGSADREFTGKVSQSIQFSHEAIEQLKKIISREF